MIEKTKKETNEEIKSFFSDILSYSNIYNTFTKLRINLEKDKSLTFETVNEEKTVILNGKFNKKYSWATSTFGIIDMNRLRSLINHPNFNTEDEDLEINISYKENQDQKEVSEIIFENKRTKSKASHRFATKEFLPEAKFKGVEWDVIVPLSISKINEIISFASIESYREQYFLPKIEENILMMYFGEENSSNHHSRISINDDVNGKFNKNLYWSISTFVSILKLIKPENQAILFISEKGIMMIKIKTNIAEYDYILRAHRK